MIPNEAGSKNTTEAIVTANNATSVLGTALVIFLKPYIMAIVAIAKTNSVILIWVIACGIDSIEARTPPALKPSTLGSWVIKIIQPLPVIKPETTVLGIYLIKLPNFNKPNKI